MFFMGRSQVILAAAQKFPGVSRPLVHGACALSAAMGRRPHWLLMRLKDTLQVRLASRARIDGFLIESDPLDGLGQMLRTEGLTEPETRALFEEFLRPGMTVLDIGAYIGQFSLIAWRTMKGTGRIICVEPTPVVFAQLKRNLELNHCDNVQPVRAAVSDREGDATFYVHVGSNDQSSLHSLAGEDQVSYQVRVTTVDALAASAALDSLHLVKIDVEGNELSVLHGAAKTLERFRPYLIIEISRHQRTVGYSGADIKAVLERLGYDCFRLGPQGRSPYQPTPDEINEQVRYFNILAIPHSSTPA
jgi:FkbM family methyltransferase